MNQQIIALLNQFFSLKIQKAYNFGLIGNKLTTKRFIKIWYKFSRYLFYFLLKKREVGDFNDNILSRNRNIEKHFFLKAGSDLGSGSNAQVRKQAHDKQAQ